MYVYMQIHIRTPMQAFDLDVLFCLVVLLLCLSRSLCPSLLFPYSFPYTHIITCTLSFSLAPSLSYTWTYRRSSALQSQGATTSEPVRAHENIET